MEKQKETAAFTPVPLILLKTCQSTDFWVLTQGKHVLENVCLSQAPRLMQPNHLGAKTLVESLNLWDA